MVLPLYLAMTPGEMAGNFASADHIACLSCHFSPWGRGLSGMPEGLPPECLLILDDRTPMEGHDPERIRRELEELLRKQSCCGLLLDFQRPGNPAQQELARILTASLPCPVGVSEFYARELNCPVFLPPVPVDRPLKDHLIPWQGREIWLEAALDGITLTLTREGCQEAPLPDFPDTGLQHNGLHCHYAIEVEEASAVFRLWRTEADLSSLLDEAKSRGVTRAIGLWQELGNMNYQLVPCRDRPPGRS